MARKLSEMLTSGYLTLALVIVTSGCASTNTDISNPNPTLVIGSVRSAVGQEIRPVSLTISSRQEGYLLCFHQNQTNSSMRFYPNRFSNDAFIGRNAVVDLPGNMPFTLTNSLDATEKVGCFLTREDIYERLPEKLRQADFTSVPYAISTIRRLLETVTENRYCYAETMI